MALANSMEAIEARARELGRDLDSVDLDSITLPPGEDFGIASDDEDLLQNEDIPELEMGFANIIVVDNLPVVPPEKYEKLENVIRKIYSQIGVIKEDGLWMPTHPDTKKTYGYCFIEYNTPQEMPRCYVVYVGRVPGVYEEWKDCQKQVNNFSGNSYQGYESREVAEEKWRRHGRKKWRNFLVITTLLLFIVGCVLLHLGRATSLEL